MTINEFCLEVLKKCGVSADVYRTRGEGAYYRSWRSVAKEIRETVQSGELDLHGFSVEDFSKELVRIGNENAPEKKISLARYFDGVRWGFCDIYNDKKVCARVKKVIESGKPFDTGWVSPSKEDSSFRVYRNVTGGPISVFVSEEMDDLYESWDLIEDAVADIGREDEFYALPETVQDQIVAQVRDAGLIGNEVSTSHEDHMEIDGKSTIEAVENEIASLENSCSDYLKDGFEFVKTTVGALMDEAK